ncbi:hypothetical protein [Actinocatenispora rupis]|uniref:DNA-directed RNA polymerase, subunit RPC12/RpoP, contains C4-type Zn-finger n=1 Tax=Actinocatenispora rupis TaxID=519421 RepID=A0A8J3NEV3_9ACTN|nr:hypothetical protein [Actinocatenispora rupis]GID14512.1 hypothetical protein Aru02nite_54010 [Actinocatenispora rupis]
MTDQAASQQAPSSYPCESCGARVEFAPGTNVLRCPYCGHEQQIAIAQRYVQEHRIEELATLPRKPVAQLTAHQYVCQKCGARTQSMSLSEACQFCGAPLVADPRATGQVVPEAVLPFALDNRAARDALRKWISSRWFAPSSLKKVTDAESTKGTYLPHWTYDSHTATRYTGARGEYYYVSESYTDSNGNRQTRQVRRTRWYPAAGEVRRFFDDVLVPATPRLGAKQLDQLAPWPLHQSVPYQPAFLAGYHTLRYEIEPEQGLNIAKGKMAEVIRGDIRRDIGGDEQRINWSDTQYAEIMYKLMLLPVWLANYLHGAKTYQVMINARSGEVIGQRPYSGAKIAAAITAGVLLLAAIITLIVIARQH